MKQDLKEWILLMNEARNLGIKKEDIINFIRKK
jgi:Anti-repressor SinI